MKPRGLRNNNPGNIRHSPTRYLGETAGKDAAFKSFESIAWGYRAMFVLLYTYQRRYGDRTLRQMIGRWAPPHENDTQAYILSVSGQSGIGADTPVTATNKDVMIPIVAAMSRHENGIAAVMAEVTAGWNLFLKHKP